MKPGPSRIVASAAVAAAAASAVAVVAAGPVAAAVAVAVDPAVAGAAAVDVASRAGNLLEARRPGGVKLPGCRFREKPAADDSGSGGAVSAAPWLQSAVYVPA